MLELNLPWTVDEETDQGAVLALDSSGDLVFMVPYDPDLDNDEDVARFTAQVICDRVNVGERVAS